MTAGTIYICYFRLLVLYYISNSFSPSVTSPDIHVTSTSNYTDNLEFLKQCDVIVYFLESDLYIFHSTLLYYQCISFLVKLAVITYI